MSRWSKQQYIKHKRRKLKAEGTLTHSKGSKGEDRRFRELEILEKAGILTNLLQQPKIPLITHTGKTLSVFTPDFFYIVKKKLKLSDKIILMPNTKVIEEYKGSKKMHAYTRKDYQVFVRWLKTDYPHFEYIENIAGEFQKPTVRYKSDTDAREFISKYY